MRIDWVSESGGRDHFVLLPRVPDDDFTNVLNVRPEAIALFESHNTRNNSTWILNTETSENLNRKSVCVQTLTQQEKKEH